MITSSQKKFVKSLSQKKFRTINQCFVVEGIKMVEELLSSDFEIHTIFATNEWISDNPEVKAVLVSSKELSSITSLKTPNQVLAIVHFKENDFTELDTHFTIALDNIQDPGNLGTIIRTADWFGINNIVCSTDSVDIYNPKVIQATMGSIFRVKVVYSNLVEFIKNSDKEIYGAVIDGNNIYEEELKRNNCILLMGNESKGISEELIPLVKHRITIPKIGQAESLNVSTATAILCAEFSK